MQNTLDQQQAEAIAARLQQVLAEAGRVIVGQREMLEGLVLGLVADGHILLEGVPGLAKTLAVRTLAQTVKAGYQRIQFTPDLLPADIVGTTVYRRETGDFTVKKGPIFSSIILADEINRAPAKVQSALLEAMQERQVTIGDQTFPLPDPFLVLATQNPLEQEGTYPLPEAQVDRFLLKLRIDYPDRDEERLILERMGAGEPPVAAAVIDAQEIAGFRRAAEAIFVDEKIKTYILDLVFATREPRRYGLELEPLLAYGASPRATLALVRLGRARALLQGRPYVVPEDIKAVGHAALRHRILLSYEAEAQELTSDAIVGMLFESIAVP
jgi:MoxR-like ATPase